MEKNLFIRWAEAFVVYFCVVVTLHSLVEYLYTSDIFKLQMVVMGNDVPSAYVYGLALGLVLSVAHFVLGKTIRRGEERLAHGYAAQRQAMLPRKRRRARRRR
jgi:hypothetical protein